MTSAQTRKLAAQIQKAVAPPRPVPSMVKGVVTAWNNTASPPTVSVALSGDTSGNTANYQYSSSYWPVVGDVVDIVSQDGKHLVMGTVASSGANVLQDWGVPTPLGGGVTSGGGGAGPLLYRVINDQGQIKTQVKGSVSISGGATGSPFGLFTLNNLGAPDFPNTRMITCVTTVGLAYIQYDSGDNVANLYGATGATAVIVDGHEFFTA